MRVGEPVVYEVVPRGVTPPVPAREALDEWSADDVAASFPRLVKVVRWALTLRLLAVAGGLWGMVGSALTWQTLLAVIVLSATSLAALSSGAVLGFVMEHPLACMVDLAVVTTVFVALGVDSPLVLAALSTALMLGVLLEPWVMVVAGATLLTGYGGALAAQITFGPAVGFLERTGLPVVLVSLIAVGAVIRTLESDQRRAEARLMDAVRRESVSEERLRIAREMHDSIAKTLQGLTLTAGALPTWIDRDPRRAAAEARALAAGISRSAAEARTLMTRMRADDLDKPFELVVAEAVEAWEAETGREVSCELVPVGPIGPGARYELLVALREALENVQRHAPDAGVLVRLRWISGRLDLMVLDDGPGFDEDRRSEACVEGHYGLPGLEERMAVVGGRARVVSAKGEGTRVVLSVPLHQGGTENR